MVVTTAHPENTKQILNMASALPVHLDTTLTLLLHKVTVEAGTINASPLHQLAVLQDFLTAL
jgi:hypothetical protein